MITFIARIVLYNADRNDYLVLDTEMKKEAFIQSKTGTAVKPAEFNYHGSLSIQYVIDAARRAAEKTGKKFSFTVMKDKGLKPAIS